MTCIVIILQDRDRMMSKIECQVYVDEQKKERAGCFALIVFLVSRDCCVALPHDATGLSAVCDCGIS